MVKRCWSEGETSEANDGENDKNEEEKSKIKLSTLIKGHAQGVPQDPILKLTREILERMQDKPIRLLILQRELGRKFHM